MSVFASSAALVLVTSLSIDWNSSRGDLIKRAYWHCFLMEWFVYTHLCYPAFLPVDKDPVLRARCATHGHLGSARPYRHSFL
jgi:hypothetical protein